MFSSASGQLLECQDCHHDLASCDFVKHGQARWLSLLFKTRSVQNAKHVVNTVGLLIIFFFFFNHKVRATSVDIFDSRDILSACVWIPDWTDIPGVVEPGICMPAFSSFWSPFSGFSL